MIKNINILTPFLEEPNREFNVRELARIINISPATSSKELKKLAKKGILKGRKERMLLLFKSNLDSEAYRDLKTYHTIKKLKETKLIEILNKFYLKPTIILFGSASQGLDTETSDIDLLVISEKTKLLETTKFEKKLKRNIHIIPTKNIKDLKNPHLINNILNGITIQGMVKWI